MAEFQAVCDDTTYDNNDAEFGTELSRCTPDRQLRLRDFCKAKAEVIFAGDSTPALHGCHGVGSAQSKVRKSARR